MELRQLLTFRAVAETRSFTRAAESLSYAQSSVTGHVQALEEELGVPLFERLGRRITLTESGARLLEYAEKMLQLADEAQLRVPAGSEPTGRLVIGSPESLCAYRLPPVLRAFRRQFPRVQLVFQPGICSELRPALGQGGLDVALLLEAPVQMPGLVIEPLLNEPMLILAHPDHPLAHMPAVVAGDLEGESLLLPEAGCAYRLMFEQRLVAAGVRAGAVMEFASVEAIKQCLLAGLGVAILPQVAVAAEVAQGRLAAVRWSEAPFEVVTQVAWHKDKWMSPALGAFLTVLRQTLAPVAR